MALSEIQKIAPATQSTFLQNYLSQIGPNLALGGLSALLPFIGEDQPSGEEVQESSGLGDPMDQGIGSLRTINAPKGELGEVYKYLTQDYDRSPSGGAFNMAGSLISGAGGFIPTGGIPNPINMIKLANSINQMVNPQYPRYDTAITGADQGTLDQLLTPILNEMGDPLPMSEGFSHGAVQGEAPGDSGYQTLSRWLKPDGSPVYDMDFIMKSQLPVASNPSDLSAILFDSLLNQNNVRLNPDASVNLRAEFDSDKGKLKWTGQAGGQEVAADYNPVNMLWNLYDYLSANNMVTGR